MSIAASRTLLWTLVLLTVVAGGLGIAWAANNASARAHEPHHADIVLRFPGNAASHRLLSISILVQHPEDGDVDAAIEEAVAAIVAEYPEAEANGSVSAQFAYTSPAYWWPAATADWVYNGDGAPAPLASVAQQTFRSAANAWNFAGGSPWRFTGGTGTSTARPCVQDGVNVVGWDDIPLSSILGSTCAWHAEDGDPATAVEFDIRFDTDANWTTGSPPVVDLYTVAMHEFGHALGLAHTNGTCPGILMCASYRDGTVYAAPQADDIAGLVARYGGGPPTPTPTPPPTLDTRRVVPGIARD